MTMAIDPKTYARWRAELAGKEPERQNIDTDINGYYRLEGARTKPAYPVAIWQQEGEEATIFQIGRQRPMNSISDSTEWFEFIGAGWLHCIAVSRDEWSVALDTGYWPGIEPRKPSRQLTEEERLDLIPTTPADQGGNMPAEEALSLEQQIAAKVDAELAKANALGAISTMEKATQAAEIVDTVRKLWKIGDTKREDEFRPHKDAADAVQAKWSGPLEKAKLLGTKLVASIEAFKRAEQTRLQIIADDEAKRAAIEREASGLAAGDAEIVAQVVAPPKISSAYGRAISRPRMKKGLITDRAAFIAAIEGQADFTEFLEAKANRLAKADVSLAGMQIYTE